jgi:hypothetical protein
MNFRFDAAIMSLNKRRMIIGSLALFVVKIGTFLKRGVIRSKRKFMQQKEKRLDFIPTFYCH